MTRALLALALALVGACQRTDSMTRAAAGERSFVLVPPSAKRPAATPRHVVDLRALSAEGAFRRSAAVTVDDPVYKRRKTYMAVPLATVLTRAIGPAAAREGDIVFETSDGYRPSMPLRRALEGGGYVAHRDTEPTSGMNWEEFDKQGSLASPAPFYVVWEGPDAAQHPWPYNLVAIEIWDRLPRLADFVDASDAAVREGVRIFEARCAQCHAMNMLGGRLGPELNVPANVTEYWNEAALRSFIADPQQVRARSRMPSSRLQPAELDAVIAYLHHMKHKKVSVP